MIGTVLAGLVCFVVGFLVSHLHIKRQIDRQGRFTIGSSTYRAYMAFKKQKASTPDAIEEAQQYRG